MTEPTITVEEQIAFIHGEAAAWLSKADAAPRSARKPFFQEAEKFEAVEATLRRVVLLEKVAEAARGFDHGIEEDHGPEVIDGHDTRESCPECRLTAAFAALDAANGKEQK